MDVSEEKITLENGKSGKGLIIKFTINNKVIKSLIDKFFDEADLPDDYLGNMSYSIEALKSQLDLLDINCTLKLYVNKKTAKTVKQVIDVKVGPKDEPNEKLDAKIVTTFSDTEIKTTFDAEGMDDKLDGEIKLTKETDKNKTVYKLTVNAGDGNGATVNFLNVSYTYNKSSGDITLVADIYSNERDRIEITLSGSITVTKSVAKIQINSLSFNGETYEFKLYLTFDKSADMPDRPANTKDVVTLTEEDIAQIAEEVSSSKLFSFIGRFEGNANKDELLP